MVINPMSISKENRDVFSNNLWNGIIYLVGEINDEMAASVIAQLQDAVQHREYFEETNPAIRLYINSPGGSVDAGFAIYDTMQCLDMPVNTICTGMAASMAAVILAGGKERFILPHGEVMIHQPSGETVGKASDILVAADHIKARKRDINEVLASDIGRDYNEMVKDTEQDLWMNARMAVEYGIVDHIIEPRSWVEEARQRHKVQRRKSA